MIGGNGSGKSTLLKLVAGMLKPTTGRITVRRPGGGADRAGRRLPPRDLGAGERLHQRRRARASRRRQIERRYAEIVEFSGLGDFMEEPVKNYSSGMYVRLGFAVAVHTDPDVLLVDEVLAVGDEAFAHRCLRRIEEFLAAGKTLLLVSHSLDLVEGVCDRVLWLDNGRQRLVGEPRRVIDAYRQEVAEQEGRGAPRRPRSEREASRGARRCPRSCAGDRGRPRSPPSACSAPAAPSATTSRPARTAVFEIRARADSRSTTSCSASRSRRRAASRSGGPTPTSRATLPGRFEGEATVRLACPALRLAPGEYVVDVAVHCQRGRALRLPAPGARLHGDGAHRRRRRLLPRAPVGVRRAASDVEGPRTADLAAATPPRPGPAADRGGARRRWTRSGWRARSWRAAAGARFGAVLALGKAAAALARGAAGVSGARRRRGC